MFPETLPSISQLLMGSQNTFVHLNDVERRMKNNGIIWFFVLTFGFTWGICAYLLFVTPSDVLTNITPSFIMLAVTSGLSPSLAAIFISLRDRSLKDLFAPVKFRFSPKLLLPALLLVPFVSFLSYMVSIKLNISISVPAIIMGLTWPLFSSLGEEFGWRGYAFTRFNSRFGFIKSSILIGLIWGIWHLPMDYIGLRSHGWLFIPEFILLGPLLLTAHSIIMSYLFCKAKCNTIVAIIYHYTITSSAILFPMFFTSETAKIPDTTILYQPAAAVVFFWIIAVILLIKGDKTILYIKK
jgi:membrane protease YdiL (CAAX protease family)